MVAPCDLFARNRRIRSLRDDDRTSWTLSRLAHEFGISKQRVAEILAAEPSQAEREAAALDREVRYRAELEELLERRHAAGLGPLERDDIRRRITVVTRSLRRLQQEREDRDIDRLLGLA